MSKLHTQLTVSVKIAAMHVLNRLQTNCAQFYIQTILTQRKREHLCGIHRCSSILDACGSIQLTSLFFFEAKNWFEAANSEISWFIVALLSDLIWHFRQKLHLPVISKVIDIVDKGIFLFSIMNIGDTFPNFTANTTIGEIDFYNWLGDS